MGGSGVIIVLIIALAAFVQAPDLDRLTGCPLGDQAPKAHTLILVDETDRLSADDLRYARSLIRTEYLWLPVGGRLTVRNIVANPDEARDITVCRMRTGSATGGVLDNDRDIKAQFDRIVGRKLEALFAELAEAPIQPASPIMEAIAATTEREDFGSSVTKRRLIVYSDLAQHSDLFSFYGRRDWRAGVPESVSHELRREMNGVKVRLHYIRRRSLSSIQGEQHREFWKAYLGDMDAQVALGHDLLIGEPPGTETWIDAQQ